MVEMHHFQYLERIQQETDGCVLLESISVMKVIKKNVFSKIKSTCFKVKEDRTKTNIFTIP